MASKQAEAKKEADAQITVNKNATRSYSLGEPFEAGMVLQGTEVKSIPASDAHRPVFPRQHL